MMHISICCDFWQPHRSEVKESNNKINVETVTSCVKKNRLNKAMAIRAAYLFNDNAVSDSINWVCIVNA